MQKHDIRSSLARTLTLLTSALLLLVSPALRAQPTSDSPLLNGLERIMRDPEKKLAVTPDKTVVFVSKAGEASFGVDGKVRLHSAGTLKRMTDISKGFSVNLGEALGHRGKGDSSMPGELIKLVKSPGLNFRLRPNQMGFGGKNYDASSRPMDIWAGKMKATICPGGVCKIKSARTTGVMGFAPSAKPVVSKKAPTAKKTTTTRKQSSARKRVSAVSSQRVRPTGSFRPRARITSQSTFKPMAMSRMRLK
jgi:hypothetical protein